MLLAGYLRWGILRALRSPVFLLGAGCLGALGALAQVLGPLGTTTKTLDPTTTLLSLAFLAVLSGTAAGIAFLDEAPFLLSRLGRVHLAAAEGGVLSVVAGLALVICLAPSLMLVPGCRTNLDLTLLRPVILTHVHVTAVGMFLRRLAITPRLRQVLLVVAVWVLPALVGGAGLVSDLIVWLLDASRPLSGSPAPLDREGTYQLSQTAWKPAAAWICAALLLEPPPPPHALRNPR